MPSIDNEHNGGLGRKLFLLLPALFRMPGPKIENNEIERDKVGRSQWTKRDKKSEKRPMAMKAKGGNPLGW
jgi:hypothetical protein